MGIHLTSQSSAYFEVRGINSSSPTLLHSSDDQGTWVWTADHDLDTSDTANEISVLSGRGILSESAGPVWLIGTCKSIVSFSFLILTMFMPTACESLNLLML